MASYIERNALINTVLSSDWSEDIQLLTENPQLVNEVDEFGLTLLHYCAMAEDVTYLEHFYVISRLLSNRADIAITNENGDTAAKLYERNQCRLYDKAKKEEERQQILYILRGEIPLQVVLKGPDQVRICMKVVEKGRELFPKWPLSVVGQARPGRSIQSKILRRQRDALLNAVIARDWSKVKQVMRENPQLVNEVDKCGMTTLHRVAYDVKAPEDLCVLLVKSATTNTLDMLYPESWLLRCCLLHQFSLHGFAECCSRVLQKSRTRINTQEDLHGLTPLHYCAVADDLTYQEHFDVISRLLSNRADIAITNKDGDTAAELYERNRCRLYDKSKKEEQRQQVFYLLRGESCDSSSLI